MSYRKLRLEQRNGVGYIFLDSGARFNKLTVNTLREIKRAVLELEQADDVSVIVLTGYPGESFAVGADISQMVHFEAEDAFRFAELGQSLFAAMEDCSKPIIGGINGITMGGGFDLAMACDIRIASEKALFAHPGSKLGIITGFCGTQKLPRLVGKNEARAIFMTADPFDAENALRRKIVNHVYSHDTFWSEMVAFGETVASKAAGTVGMAKKVINAAEDIDLKNGCLLEQAAFSALCGKRYEK